MPNPVLAGSIFSSDGFPVNGATVKVFTAGDTGTALSCATSDVNGYP